LMCVVMSDQKNRSGGTVFPVSVIDGNHGPWSMVHDGRIY